MPTLTFGIVDADIVYAGEPANTRPHSLQKVKRLLLLAVAYPGDYMRYLAVVAALQS
jgi:hypothetical protein